MDYIKRIINAKTIAGLKRTVNDFWYAFHFRESDDVLLLLEDELKAKRESSIHRWLYSYLTPCNDGVEFMKALVSFQVDCEVFRNVNKNTTVQIEEKEFMEIVEECNRSCKMKKLLTDTYKLNVIETGKGVDSHENCFLIIDKTLNVFLPRVPTGTNHRKYIGEILGLLIYEIGLKNFGGFRLCRNLRDKSRKIRNSPLGTQELYKIFFYNIFLADEMEEECCISEREAGIVANHLMVVIADINYNSKKTKRT